MPRSKHCQRVSYSSPGDQRRTHDVHDPVEFLYRLFFCLCCRYCAFDLSIIWIRGHIWRQIKDTSAKINISYVILCVKLHIPIFTRILHRFWISSFNSPELGHYRPEMFYELAGLAVALGLIKYATSPGKHFYDYSATINQGRPGKL